MRLRGEHCKGECDITDVGPDLCGGGSVVSTAVVAGVGAGDGVAEGPLDPGERGVP
jgi:hypothetical protein